MSPNDGYEKNGIVWNAEFLSDRITEDYLVIADCNFNDFVLLKLAGPESRFDGVWHWDSAPLEGERYAYWLADSFHDFLSMLIYDNCFDEEDRESLPLF